VAQPAAPFDRRRHIVDAPTSQLPPSYYIDESDPDVVTLHREDSSFVAAFSAGGATKEGIVEAAREDYRKLMQGLARRSGDRRTG
jgi:hypothetical protein